MKDFFAGIFVVSVFTCLFEIQLGQAQILYAEIGVNGLTCSACSKSVEMSIRKLGFVSDVDMNLAATTAKVHFRKDAVPSLYALAQSVKDAGFSVRYCKVFLRNDSSVQAKECFSLGTLHFQTEGSSSAPPGDTLCLQLLGKDFMPPSEWKKARQGLRQECTADQGSFYFARTE